MRADQHYVLAALDGPPTGLAVAQVATVMADVLQLPLRAVHVVPGTGLRGLARRSAMERIERGETDEIRGRPEDVLTHLVERPGCALAVLGIRQRPRRPGTRRFSGTAVAVARRVDHPLLLVPPAATTWTGPRRVLTPLDGTGRTAMAAANALTRISGPDTVGLPLHVGDGNVRRFWGSATDDDAWRQEFRSWSGETTAESVAPGGPVGQLVLDSLTATSSDLLVLVWSRQSRGGHSAAVLDILAATTVPVLLVPVQDQA
ncbi:MAG: universal stress protein [Acidimicrobiales bacterium]